MHPISLTLLHSHPIVLDPTLYHFNKQLYLPTYLHPIVWIRYPTAFIYWTLTLHVSGLTPYCLNPSSCYPPIPHPTLIVCSLLHPHPTCAWSDTLSYEPHPIDSISPYVLVWNLTLLAFHCTLHRSHMLLFKSQTLCPSPYCVWSATLLPTLSSLIPITMFFDRLPLLSLIIQSIISVPLPYMLDPSPYFVVLDPSPYVLDQCSTLSFSIP